MQGRYWEVTGALAGQGEGEAQWSVAFCPCMSQFEGEAPPKTRSTCTSTCTSAQTSLVSNFNSICCWKLDAEFIISWTNLQFSSPISHRVSTSWSQHWGDVGGRTHLHKSFHRCAAQTSCDTNTWGRGPSPRRCAGNRRCRSYKSLSKRTELK